MGENHAKSCDSLATLAVSVIHSTLGSMAGRSWAVVEGSKSVLDMKIPSMI
jgi:hypothetical protein